MDNMELNEVFNRIREKKKKQEERKKDKVVDNKPIDDEKKNEVQDKEINPTDNIKEGKDKKEGKEKVSFLRIMFERKGK